MTPALVAPLLVWVVCALVIVAPVVAARRVDARGVAATLGVLGLLAAALATDRPALGYALLAATAVVHAGAAWPRTRTGAAWLLLAALCTGVTSAALARGAPDVAFVASLAAIALRAGVMPLHVGVAALTDRAAPVQTRQLGSAIGLVYLHLLHVDHLPLAAELAPTLVRLGAAATVAPALQALVARDAVGWMRASTVMHAGLLFCAVGAAGNGHYAAALLEAITLALAVGGMGVVIAGLEARCGRTPLADFGGRAGSLPRLCAAFALFGAAGVGLPATAGFIADDLLLHALWEESQVGSAAVVLAAAVLAVATLAAWSKTFLGPPRPSAAEDLSPRERLALVPLLVALLALGLAPQAFMTPITAVLGAPPEAVSAR